MPRSTQTLQKAGRAGFARYLPLLVIIVVATVAATTLRNDLNFDVLRANRAALIAFRDAHYALTALSLIVAYTVIVAFSLPGATIATLAGGFLFGVFPGVLCNLTGATLGATLIFLAARCGLGERLAARLDASDGRMKRVMVGIHDNELSFLFLIRLVPMVPFFVANLVPALVGVSLARFVFTTFFGIIPGALVYTWVGAGLGDVFASGETPDLTVIFKPQILGPILALCVLALAPVVLKAFRKSGDR